MPVSCPLLTLGKTLTLLKVVPGSIQLWTGRTREVVRYSWGQRSVKLQEREKVEFPHLVADIPQRRCCNLVSESATQELEELTCRRLAAERIVGNSRDQRRSEHQIQSQKEDMDCDADQVPLGSKPWP